MPKKTHKPLVTVPTTKTKSANKLTKSANEEPIESATSQNEVVAVSSETSPPLDEIAPDVQLIPKRLLHDDSQIEMDLVTFVRIMRGNRDEIDTDHVDITLDPFASAFIWRSVGSSAFYKFPDVQRLANQVASHMNKINEKERMNDDDMQFIRNITQFDYKRFRAERFKDQGIDMQQLRNTDPMLILINQAIYSKPLLPPGVDFHKLAEEFALHANCFEKLEEPRPPSKPITTSQNNSSETLNGPNQNQAGSFWRNGPEQARQPLYARVSTQTNNALETLIGSNENQPGTIWRNGPEQARQPLYSRISTQPNNAPETLIGSKENQPKTIWRNGPDQTGQPIYSPITSSQNNQTVTTVGSNENLSSNIWRNGIEQTGQPLYSRILQRNLANSAGLIAPGTLGSSDGMLYPQTMLLTAPNIPAVYPDMTTPAAVDQPRKVFLSAPIYNFFDRYSSNQSLY